MNVYDTRRGQAVGHGLSLSLGHEVWLGVCMCFPRISSNINALATLAIT